MAEGGLRRRGSTWRRSPGCCGRRKRGLPEPSGSRIDCGNWGSPSSIVNCGAGLWEPEEGEARRLEELDRVERIAEAHSGYPEAGQAVPGGSGCGETSKSETEDRGALTGVRVAVGGDPIHFGEDRVHGGDVAPVGAAGRAGCGTPAAPDDGNVSASASWSVRIVNFGG